MVYATMCITVLSFIVWLHHFFTMGSGANVNAFFGITTMIISIPTGVKIFNWLFTMYRGRVRFEVPVLWTLGFIVTFAIGGMTGVLMAVPPADFVLHNSLFLIAHFHNAIIGGVVFGVMAGFSYWFPKATGFKLDPFLGKVSFWCWLVGFYVAFMPIYALGLMGMTRRLAHVDNPVWQAYLVVAAVGAVIIGVGIAATVLQVALSIIRRDKLKDTTGDPWNGRTLEWATSSPPAFYNFANVPVVKGIDAFWTMKQEGTAPKLEPSYAKIHMPKNTGTGFIIGMMSIGLGFALTWHIWWMAAGAFLAMIGMTIWHSFDEHRDWFVPSETVARTEALHFKAKVPEGVQ
jgi:cytochrome o ubiquinol oxidase subunit 1